LRGTSELVHRTSRRVALTNAGQHLRHELEPAALLRCQSGMARRDPDAAVRWRSEDQSELVEGDAHPIIDW
jgi:hypothetical protein